MDKYGNSEIINPEYTKGIFFQRVTCPKISTMQEETMLFIPVPLLFGLNRIKKKTFLVTFKFPSVQELWTEVFVSGSKYAW